jgi:hypothetical protein
MSPVNQLRRWIRSAPWVSGFAAIASLVTLSVALGILRMPSPAALTLKGHNLAVMSVQSFSVGREKRRRPPARIGR